MNFSDKRLENNFCLFYSLPVVVAVVVTLLNFTLLTAWSGKACVHVKMKRFAKALIKKDNTNNVNRFNWRAHSN